MNTADNPQSNVPIWHQRTGEPHKWFIRFEYFRTFGPRRSLYATYQKELEQSGKSRNAQGAPKAWHAAAELYEWSKRAQAWDVAQVESENVEWIERRRKLREKEWAVALSLIAKAEQMLVFPLAATSLRHSDDGQTTITEYKPTRWSMADAGRLMDTASKLARLAAEMATSHERIENMTDAQIAELIQKELGTGTPSGAGSVALPANSPNSDRITSIPGSEVPS